MLFPLSAHYLVAVFKAYVVIPFPSGILQSFPVKEFKTVHLLLDERADGITESAVRRGGRQCSDVDNVVSDARNELHRLVGQDASDSGSA